MCAKCGIFAVKLFDKMPEREVASWNTAISCYYQDVQAGKVLDLFDRMVGDGFRPYSVTFPVASSACVRVEDLERGRRIHEELAWSRVELDGLITDMYGKCGCLQTAREVFETMKVRSVV